MATETLPAPASSSTALPPTLRARRRVLPGAFAAVIIVFILVNALVAASVYVALGTKGVQSRTREIVSGALSGVELVARVQHDVDRERHLIDAHIFETQAATMAGLEARITDVETDLTVTLDALLPQVRDSDAAALWASIVALIEAQQRDVQRVVSLSRANADLEAHHAMLALEDRFDVISGQVDQLTGLERRRAARVADEVAAVQRSTVALIVSLTFAGVLLSVLLAALVTRMLSRRDQELLQAYWLVESRNRELDAFAGRVAHDLRGPLTAISFAEAARSRSVGHEESTTAVVQRGVSRMEGIIQDLLVLSRVGVAPRSMGQCDPAPVAESVREELSPHLAGEVGEVHIEVEHARVRCTDGLLRQALWNLADNALKYRRRGVPLDLEIRGQVVGNSYELCVKDNGMGMSAEEAVRVFEPFFRAEAAHDKAGTGLGLSIVKRIVEAVGGTVSVASEVERGTTFDIHLPLADAR